MKLNELKNRLMQTFFRKNGDVSRRPDGGTSCYRPIRKKTQAEIREQEEQPLTYIHTGFTGMNPPAETGYGPDPYSQPNYGGQAGFVQPAYGQQGYAGQQTWPQQAWLQQDPGMQGGIHQDFGMQGGNQPGTGGQNGYQQGFGGQTEYARTAREGGAGRNRNGEAQASASRPERGWFPPREEAMPRSNISYMPGYAPDAGAAPFSHVEHIMTMTGLKSCYEAIECMKNGETLIVELDAIANDNESMRCQDMLAGAAFTLGCSVRMLQNARLVLIAPEGVKILPEEAPARQENVPPVYAAPAAEAAPRQRERRSGRNAADWEAARNGQLNNYNPYTGTMPVAAGSYAGFGGYGY